MPTDPPSPIPSFDLVHRPWIPVQRLDGIEEELSLLDVFAHASGLRRIVGDVPTMEFALMRLLLAILHDAVDGPAELEDWGELWGGGRNDLPSTDVAKYLDRHRDRFDLLHPRTPFFQTADLRTAKGEYSSLDRIVADVPNGHLFFTMRNGGVDRLGFAEAARWIVHAHAFDSSGIKSGAEGDPRAKGGKGYPQGVGWAGSLGGVFAEGADLRETLLLNLVAADVENLRIDDNDRPAWRREPCTAAPADDLASRPSGLRDLYTWQSRRLRLHFDTDGVYGVLLGYGDPLASRNRFDREPMTAWRRSPVQEKKLGMPQVYLPREHDPARSAWRGLGALVTGRVQGAEQRQEAAAIVRPRILDWVAGLANDGYLDADHLIRARVIGAVYGTQQSVIDEIVDDGVSMQVVVLHRQNPEFGVLAVDAVNDADAGVHDLGNLAAALAEAAGADKDAPRATARDRAFGALDGLFRDWLARLGPATDIEAHHTEWQRTVRRTVLDLGDRLVKDAGDAAWTGRVISTANGSIWLSASRAQFRFFTDLKKSLPLANVEPIPEASE